MTHVATTCTLDAGPVAKPVLVPITLAGVRGFNVIVDGTVIGWFGADHLQSEVAMLGTAERRLDPVRRALRAELVEYLHSAEAPLTVEALAFMACVDDPVVVEALGDLARAGVVLEVGSGSYVLVPNTTDP